MMRRFGLAIAIGLTLVACSAESDSPPPAATPTAAPVPGAIPAPADVAAIPADAQTSASGLAWKVLKAGTGTAHPAMNSIFVAHYTGWTTDGKMFDSSVARGEPLGGYPVGRMIPGWQEALQAMVVGEKRRLWIPSKLAYDGAPGSPQGMLVFEVELLDFK
jgi:FKBP-type peptidyl-prolyl cis-trans isomerase